MMKLDYIPKTNIKMIHVDKAYNFGVDSIILLNFAQMKINKNLVDIGAGSGVLSLGAMAMYDLASVIGIEIQEHKAKLFRDNIKLNNLENISVINKDLNNINLYNNSIDYIITNPPYYKVTDNISNKDEEFLISRQEKYLSLDDIFNIANIVLKDRAKLFMIHKPERMVDIFKKSGNLKPKRIKFVHSRADKKPQLILIEFIKNAYDGLLIEDPLIIYDGDNYSKNMNKYIGLL